MKYYVDIPYPKIRVERPNVEYAILLSDAYAGRTSEESAIGLYIFEHISLSDTHKEYADILKQIAIVEMHHLDMLGKLIDLLGMKPTFMKYDKRKGLIPWNSSYIDYNIDINNIVDIDIKSEENAIEIYRHILSIIKDKYIVEIIERIIKDEELHLDIFKEFKKRINLDC